MKQLLRAFLFLSLLLPGSLLNAQRYLSNVFSGVTVTSDIEYSQNITVITGSPVLDTLVMDVYEPTGDTLAFRPLIIFAHTGSFLPVPQNGQCTGSKTDSSVVELCTSWAKRGYVVAAIDNRLGWNPVSPTQEVRTGTLLNAAYRGIQDARACQLGYIVVRKLSSVCSQAQTN